MMNCKEISRLASERFDRELGLLERMRFRMHVMMCHHCWRYARQLVFLRRAIRRLAAARAARGPGLSPEARDRIARRLDTATHNPR
jgi:hypothetical protein